MSDGPGDAGGADAGGVEAADPDGVAAGLASAGRAASLARGDGATEASGWQPASSKTPTAAMAVRPVGQVTASSSSIPRRAARRVSPDSNA